MPSRKRGKQDYLIQVADDGLLTAEVGPWAEDKYRRVGMYAQIFATGMKHRWDLRVYLDLFAGPGHVRIRDTRRVVRGSPLIALSLPDRFDRYVFADENQEAIAALRARATRLAPDTDTRYVGGNVNDRVEEIRRLLPQDGPDGRVLSFCFLDPFKLNIHFDTVRRLADNGPMDFLILLALHVDANRNMERYAAEESAVIDRFLGDADWRTRWETARSKGVSVVEFLAGEYAMRMSSTLGYLRMTLQDMVKIRSHEKRLPLYYLAFFSRSELALRFWREVLRYSDNQLRLL